MSITNDTRDKRVWLLEMAAITDRCTPDDAAEHLPAFIADIEAIDVEWMPEQLEIATSLIRFLYTRRAQGLPALPIKSMTFGA